MEQQKKNMKDEDIFATSEQRVAVDSTRAFGGLS